MTFSRRTLIGLVVGLAVLATGGTLAVVQLEQHDPVVAHLSSGPATTARTPAPTAPTAAPRRVAAPPPARHVFVVNIENKDYAKTWGPGSPAPYLARTLRAKGALLTQYYATAHLSLGNYLAQISGQAPDPEIQSDCKTFADFTGEGTVPPGQYVGRGCVFPAETPTLAGQLDAAGLTWRGYMQDMGTSCRHPAVGSEDDMQRAEKGDQYATRHNPFMYFHAIIDRPRYCRRHVVDLSKLPQDLQLVRTTRNFTYITPDLCSDGHDSPCVDGRPGGLESINAWLKRWIPRILDSRAFRRNGLLVITADESDGPSSDSSACCNELPGPNSPVPGITGPGGGRVGALVISPWTAPGSRSATPYNHYSLLASVEDLFGVSRLGYAAQDGLVPFGADVYNADRP